MRETGHAYVVTFGTYLGTDFILFHFILNIGRYIFSDLEPDPGAEKFGSIRTPDRIGSIVLKIFELVPRTELGRDDEFLGDFRRQCHEILEVLFKTKTSSPGPIRGFLE